MTTPYRADQVGSLLRPPELLAARAEHAGGRLPREELRAIEDRAILDALEQQRQTRRLTAEESAFLRAHAPGPFKITLPSPTQFGHSRFRPGITDPFYAT